RARFGCTQHLADESEWWRPEAIDLWRLRCLPRLFGRRPICAVRRKHSLWWQVDADLRGWFVPGIALAASHGERTQRFARWKTRGICHLWFGSARRRQARFGRSRDSKNQALAVPANSLPKCLVYARQQGRGVRDHGEGRRESLDAAARRLSRKA